jgi:hypothetical protein
MPVKILMSWDIAPEHEEEYFEFVVREFLPGVQGLGFELSDAWATVYGSKPQILVGAMLPTMGQAQQVLDSSEWISLNNRLQDYVRNYRYKLVPAKGGFQF